MRLATFTVNDDGPRAALVNERGVFDIAARIPDSPSSMIGIIESLERLKPALQKLGAEQADHALDQVRLLAPIPRPGKIMCLGLNYRDHAAEAAMALPESQLWFAKMQTAVNGPYDAIQLPRVSTKLDYEAELAVIIGRRCRHVSRADAAAVIAGYCVANDVSVRDWQLRTSQFVLGKSFDTHAPFGPWIVTADEISDPQKLGIRCLVNGQTRQNSNTREMVFDCLAMIEHLSQAMTLEPGDVILTGTPAGVGAVSKPPRFLVAGDVVRVEIDGIGAIENRVELEVA
jgi:2-keto-4-pentenoate hydratase/2-oxohepta-3-ene-1,7-dioic acid hydratase in catechol pathway